jgi:hypothetical protein
MGVVGRLDQYGSMLAYEFDDYSMSENLALNSEAINSWTNNGNAISISANSQVAPDGTLTSDVLSQTAVTGAGRWVSSMTRTYTAGVTYTLSIWLKKISGTDAQPSIDLWINGIPQQSVGTITTEWVRYSKSFTPASTISSNTYTGLNIGWDPNGAANNFTFAAWGFQVETGSVATDYTPTTTTAINRVLASTTNTNITGLGTYYSSGFDENVGFTTFLPANVFAPYDPVYDEFSGTSFGAGQGRYMRQNTDKSVIVYNEIDEITDFRDIVRSGLVLDLDAGMYTSYSGSGTTWYDLTNSSSSAVSVGQSAYTTAGTYTFTVPSDITTISAVVVGGGGGGAGADNAQIRNATNGGGGGGGLAYGTISVTPGETLTITVGTGGNGGVADGNGGAGGTSTIVRSATTLLSGGGGTGGIFRNNGNSTGGASGGTDRIGGGSGGAGGTQSANGGATGGGGAGGYSGNGGAGGAFNAAGSASTGAGGGGGGGFQGTQILFVQEVVVVQEF